MIWFALGALREGARMGQGVFVVGQVIPFVGHSCEGRNPACAGRCTSAAMKKALRLQRQGG